MAEGNASTNAQVSQAVQGRNPGWQRAQQRVLGEFGPEGDSRARIDRGEMRRRAAPLARYVKRGGQIWIRVFPDVRSPRSPLEVRMGSARATSSTTWHACSPAKCCSRWRRGRGDGPEAFRLAGSKLSVSTSFVKRQVR